MKRVVFISITLFFSIIQHTNAQNDDCGCLAELVRKSRINYNKIMEALSTNDVDTILMSDYQECVDKCKAKKQNSNSGRHSGATTYTQTTKKVSLPNNNPSASNQPTKTFTSTVPVRRVTTPSNIATPKRTANTITIQGNKQSPGAWDRVNANRAAQTTPRTPRTNNTPYKNTKTALKEAAEGFVEASIEFGVNELMRWIFGGGNKKIKRQQELETQRKLAEINKEKNRIKQEQLQTDNAILLSSLRGVEPDMQQSGGFNLKGIELGNIGESAAANNNSLRIITDARLREEPNNNSDLASLHAGSKRIDDISSIREKYFAVIENKSIDDKSTFDQQTSGLPAIYSNPTNNGLTALEPFEGKQPENNKHTVINEGTGNNVVDAVFFLDKAAKAENFGSVIVYNQEGTEAMQRIGPEDFNNTPNYLDDVLNKAYRESIPVVNKRISDVENNISTKATTARKILELSKNLDDNTRQILETFADNADNFLEKITEAKIEMEINQNNKEKQNAIQETINKLEETNKEMELQAKEIKEQAIEGINNCNDCSPEDKEKFTLLLNIFIPDF